MPGHGSAWLWVVAAAALWLVWRVVGIARAMRVRRRIRGRPAAPSAPVARGVFRARPWRGGAGAPPAGYHRPTDLEVDDQIPPPPRPVDGVYGE